MNLSTFDLNLLRVLDALLREQSTVMAGERIGLSQPAVSSALRRLRHALNDPLFVREGQRVGSAAQTVKAFRKEGLLFPSRLHNSQTVFRTLTASTAMRVLTNPRYAGAYAYGRR